MQVTVDTRDFVNACSRYITRGKRRVKSPIGSLVTTSIVDARDGHLTFHGCDSSFVIYAYFSINADVIEEGNFRIDRTDELVKNLKRFSGKKLTIECDGNVVSYKSGREIITEPLQEIKNSMELEDWFKIYHKETDNVYMEFDDKQATYTKWFTINGSLLNDIEDVCLNSVGDDLLNIETKDNLVTLSCENNNTKRRYENSYEVFIDNEQKFSIEYIFPIFSQLKGNSTFYYYVTKSGRLRIIIENGSNWWFCRYDKTS